MARPDLTARLHAQRALRDAQGRRRTRRTVSRRDGVRLEVDGQWLTGFCSNDYLGLAQQFSVVNALQDAAAREGAGAALAPSAGHHACTTRWSAKWPSGWATRVRCCSAVASPPTWPCSRRC
jgi:8-amino-7-oxononanoate synthase